METLDLYYDFIESIEKGFKKINKNIKNQIILSKEIVFNEDVPILLNANKMLTIYEMDDILYIQKENENLVGYKIEYKTVKNKYINPYTMIITYSPIFKKFLINEKEFFELLEKNFFRICIVHKIDKDLLNSIENKNIDVLNQNINI